MATNYINLKGKLKWTQNIQNADEYGGNKFWKVTMYDLDEESMKAFKASGIRIRPKEDKDGDTLYTFRRPCSKQIKGEMIEFDPPAYVDNEGNPVTVRVANGSEATVNLAVYDAGAMGKGHRLQGVKVTKLIEYVPDEEPQAMGSIDKSIFE